MSKAVPNHVTERWECKGANWPLSLYEIAGMFSLIEPVRELRRVIEQHSISYADLNWAYQMFGDSPPARRELRERAAKILEPYSPNPWVAASVVGHYILLERKLYNLSPEIAKTLEIPDDIPYNDFAATQIAHLRHGDELVGGGGIHYKVTARTDTVYQVRAKTNDQMMLIPVGLDEIAKMRRGEI